jgi:TP901 family phage tail tape measure protein
MSALRELLAVFGISVDTKELEKADDQIEGFVDGAKKAGKILLEAFAVHEVKEFVQEQIEAGAQLKIMSERLGTTTDELQALELAANEAGVSSDSLTTGLRLLNRHLGEAAKGTGDGAQLFKKMGIAIKDAHGIARPAGDVLGDLADHIASIEDPAKKTEIAMKLLGRGGAELIPLLNRGGAAFDEARKKMQELGGGMSVDFVEAAHKAEEANVDLDFAMKGLKTTIAGAVLPIFSQVVQWITHLVGDVIDFTRKTHVLTTGLEFLGLVAGVKALTTLRELAKVFGLLKPTIGETALALAKFIGPIATIALLYLIFDELFTLMDGGDTIIGRVVDHFFGLGSSVSLARDLNETFAATLDVLEGLGEQIVSALVTPLMIVVDIVKGLYNQLAAVVGLFNGGSFGDIVKAAGKMGDEITSDVKTGGRGIAEGAAEIGGMGPRQAAERKRWRQRNMSQAQRDAENETEPGTGTGFRHGTKPREALSFTREPVPPHLAGAAAPHQITISQKNDIKVEVKTTPEDATVATGNAIGAGIATPTQRAHERAIRATRKP